MQKSAQAAGKLCRAPWLNLTGKGPPPLCAGEGGARSPLLLLNWCLQPRHKKSQPLRPRLHHCLAFLLAELLSTGDFGIASMKNP